MRTEQRHSVLPAAETEFETCVEFLFFLICLLAKYQRIFRSSVEGAYSDMCIHEFEIFNAIVLYFIF